MAKSFSNIKKGLGLLDIIQIGKYKGCRVDSIIEQDDDYLRYMHTEKILVLLPEVLDALKNKFTADSIAAESDRAQRRKDLEEYGIATLFPNWKRPYSGFTDMEDDIPF